MAHSAPTEETQLEDPAEGTVAVSVLVPVRDEADHLEPAVAAMRAQRFDGRVELLFADGGSQDDTRAILEQLSRDDPRIRVFDNPGKATPSGLNVCLAHAHGEYVARMDAHTVYPDTYLADGVRRLRAGGTTWVSGPQVPVGTTPVGRAVALALAGPLGRGGSRKWGGDDAAGGGSEFELDTGVFAGVWRRDTVLRHGGWDERWPINQDSEMASRFLRDGEVLICLPAMGARYTPRSTLRGLSRQYRRYGYYRARTAVHHPPSLRRSHLLPPAIVVTIAAAVAAPRALRRPARAGATLYGAALVFSGARAAAGARAGDAALVPAVLAVMHLAHGAGFLQGCLRFGAPWRALARQAGLPGSTGDDRAASREPVWAPSLSPGA